MLPLKINMFLSLVAKPSILYEANQKCLIVKPFVYFSHKIASSKLQYFEKHHIDLYI